MTTLTIILNGQPRVVGSGQTMEEMLFVWGYDPSVPLAVALDEQVLLAAELATIKPSDGSRIEVISLQQGG